MPQYFDGEVRFLKGGLFRSTFSLMHVPTASYAVFTVSNGSHVRDLPSIRVPSSPFRIVASLRKIRVLEGVIPQDCIQEMTEEAFSQLKSNIENKKKMSL